MTHVTCRLTAKNRDQLRNPIRSLIEYGLHLPFYLSTVKRRLKELRVFVCRRTERGRSMSGALFSKSALSITRLFDVVSVGDVHVISPVFQPFSALNFY